MSLTFGSVQVHLVGHDRDAVRVAVVGELDLHTAEEFCTTLLAMLDRTRADRCELDLSKVGFCGVAGLRALLRVRTAMAQTGSRMVITIASPAVHMLLTVSNTGPLLGYPPGSSDNSGSAASG